VTCEAYLARNVSRAAVHSLPQLLSAAGARGRSLDCATFAARPAERYRFQYLPQLDGFRGVAILLVLLAHTVESSSVPLKWKVMAGPLGALGVLLFFVLSGFLITGVLLAERCETGGISLRNFYLRRVLRLFPALFVFLVMMWILVKSRAIPYISNWEFFACLFYARNFYGQSMALGHIWSLSLEEQFYLCWPFLLCILPMKRLLRVAVAATLTIAVFRAVAIHFDLFHLPESVYYMRPYFRLDSLLIGACLALAVASRLDLRERARSAMARVPAGFLWLGLLGWSIFATHFHPSVYQSIQLCLAVLLLAQLVAGQGRWYQQFFRHPVLRYLGKISYALYLWQQPFLLARTTPWGPLAELWRTPLWLLPPLLLAILSYHCLESPALRLKKRLEYWPGRTLELTGKSSGRAFARSV
jgi:peptidoglycan/LPS O-acetylase OafA/YrhL